MRGVFHYALCCLTLLLGASTVSLAEAPLPYEATLTIGREWTAVRALYRVPLLVGSQKVVLGGIPADADLSSLLVRDRRVHLTVLRAERDPLLTRDKAPQSTDASVWRRDSFTPSVVSAGHVTVLLDSPLGGTRQLEVIYLTRGFRWSASYQLRTRGDLRSTEEERFSVDLAGFAEIVNKTGQAFPPVRCYLTGAESPVPRSTPDEPGFLALSDSPLADLWKDRSLPEAPESLYAVEGVHLLPCDEQISTPILDALRIPAEREYVMNSKEIPLAAKGAGAPLREVIRFANTKNNGIGRSLPSGPVLIFRTGAMRYRMTTATLNAAGVHDMIHIDLGTDVGVLAYRSRLERREGALKTFVERYGIRLVNNKEQPVQIVIRETPQTVLEWTVIRSGESCTRKGQAFEMHTVLDAHSEKMIEYSLQIKQPEL